MPGNYLPSTQELLYAKRKTLFPGQRPLTTGWLLSSCLGLHHCPALMGLMFPVEKLVPRGGWFSDHWSRVDGTFGFLVQISLQAMGGCSLQLGPSNSLEEETSWALQCPTSCFTWILTAGGATTKKPHHHRAEMLPGCGWAIHGGDCLPRKRRVYGEETWRGQISLPASQGE